MTFSVLDFEQEDYPKVNLADDSKTLELFPNILQDLEIVKSDLEEVAVLVQVQDDKSEPISGTPTSLSTSCPYSVTILYSCHPRVPARYPLVSTRLERIPHHVFLTLNFCSCF